MSVVVAGAGALGSCCALALARKGFAVTVCDPAPPFAGASGVAAGMLAPVFEAVLDPLARPHFDLLLAARDLWPELEARAGVALDRTGALAAGRPEWIAGLAAGLTQLGLHPTPASPAAARALAPGLLGEAGLSGKSAAGDALWNREDWRLEPSAALAALRRAAEAAGAVFRAEAVRGPGEADLLVVASGADPGLLDLAPELASLSPIKGHIVRVGRLGLAHAVVRGEAVYVAPCAGGVAVGATMEPGVADPTPDPTRAAPLLAAGAALFPALAQAPYALAAGVRAATPDGLPLVGFSRAGRVLLATGARRNGWLLAPLVARVIAALAAGRDPGPHAARLDPRRFG
jgi:glycine oxidase